jgi:outer membrane protein assembly factor BamB
MKKKQALTLVLFALIALILSACGGAPTAASWPGITVDEVIGAVYVAYGQHVYALNAENGSEQWRFPAERQNKFTVFSAPALTEDGQLLFGAYDHIFYSIDAADGSQNWAFEGASNRYIGSPLSTEAGIFVSNADHNLYALDASGDLQWTFSSLQPQWSHPFEYTGAVYVPSLDHHLYSVDAQTGQELWNADLGGTLVSDAVVADEVAFIGTLNSEMLGIDASNGNVLWRTPTEGWVWGTPTLYDGVLYAGDLEGVLYAFEPTNGTELWRVDTEGPITGSPLVVDDHIYIVNEAGRVMSITLDGDVTWTKTFDAKLYGSAAAAGELILFGQPNNTTLLIALDQNGNTVWSFMPEN